MQPQRRPPFIKSSTKFIDCATEQRIHCHDSKVYSEEIVLPKQYAQTLPVLGLPKLPSRMGSIDKEQSICATVWC